MNDAAPPPARGRIRRWLDAHHLKLISIKDTPHSVALGSAIGMFFGWTPLWSLKTLLSIGFAWVFRSNKIAAVIAVTLHDLTIPFLPALYVSQYKVGMWVLHGRASERGFRKLATRDFLDWTNFFTVGKPILIGSLFFAVPCAIATYFLVRAMVNRARIAKPATSG